MADEKETITTSPDWSRAEIVLEGWNRRARKAQKAQYKAVKIKRRQHYALGMMALIFTAITGASALGTLLDKFGMYGKVTTVALSVASSIIVGLQTFLKLETQAGAHNASAAGYGAVRRSLEIISALPIEQRGTIKEQLSVIKPELNRLASDSPIATLTNKETAELGKTYRPLFPMQATPASNKDSE